MHKRAERVDTAAGESTNRKITEHQLDGGFQSSDHGPPYALLRQRGKDRSFLSVMQNRIQEYRVLSR